MVLLCVMFMAYCAIHYLSRHDLIELTIEIKHAGLDLYQTIYCERKFDQNLQNSLWMGGHFTHELA